MYLAKVVGTVVSTSKDERLVGFKLLLIQRVHSDGAAGGGHDVGHGLHPGEILGQSIGAEHVRLAQAHEKAGGRQRRDGEHERTSEPLSEREGAAPLLLVRHGSPLSGSGMVGHVAAPGAHRS